jgi:hypothetical protein
MLGRQGRWPSAWSSSRSGRNFLFSLFALCTVASEPTTGRCVSLRTKPTTLVGFGQSRFRVIITRQVYPFRDAWRPAFAKECATGSFLPRKRSSGPAMTSFQETKGIEVHFFPSGTSSVEPAVLFTSLYVVIAETR